MSADQLKYNVVDSCGWLEYFAGDLNADFFEPPLLHTATLIVPALCLYEVGKRLLLTRGEAAALEALEMMRKARVVQLDEDQLFLAAKASAKYGLSMGDAMIWQTAQSCSANLYTQDAGMKELPSVLFKATVKKHDSFKKNLSLAFRSGNIVGNIVCACRLRTDSGVRVVGRFNVWGLRACCYAITKSKTPSCDVYSRLRCHNKSGCPRCHPRTICGHHKNQWNKSLLLK